MILVFGGTSDSLKLCDGLGKLGLDYIVSVTTDYGKKLSLVYTNQILEGKLGAEEMVTVIQTKGIDLIIDATHPYAIEVSKEAMKAAQDLALPYIRYERASLLDQVQGEDICIVEDIEEACDRAREIGDTIFLGTGSKTLAQFVRALPDKKIIARVLPTSEVILECEALGLNPDHIIGMKGPFSTEMNEVMYKHYGIDCMITKESGIEGGFLEKIESCKKLGVKVIVIKRKVLVYPNVKYTVEDVLKEVKKMRSKS